MNFKTLGAAALIAAVGLCAPAIAQEKDQRSWSGKPVATGSDADKTIARARAVTKCLEFILADWSFSAIRGEQRKKLMHSMFDVLRGERFKERRGKWRYSAKVSMSEARNRVLDALEVQDTFGAEKIIVVVHPDCYKGPKIDEDEVEAIWEQLRTGVSDYLNSHRFREAPNTGQKSQIMKAALELGASPSNQKMHQFGQMFLAPVVVSVKGKIRFEPIKPGSAQYSIGKRGYLRVQAMKGTVYHRDSDTVLGTFTIKSTKQKSEMSESNTDSIYQPYWDKDESLSELTENYAAHVGKYIATHLCKRLFDRFYAMQPAPSAGGGGGGGPRDCPGCGDKIVDNSLTACPACESELPAVKGGGGGGGGGGARSKEGPPFRAMDNYQLRFKGFDDDDVETAIEELQGNKSFGKWKDAGATKVFVVYKCAYRSETMITSAVKDALKDADIYDGCKVTKTGNNINIIKKK
ncbi:MAG: hypothetical protein JKY65_07360 [Planctomycetes bacterium]|nr:hypothetical protein [Planctomycetota bacterium]